MELEFPSLLLPSILFLLLLLLLSAHLFLNLKASPPKPTSSTVLLKNYPIIGNLPHFVKNGRRLLEWVDQLLAASPSGTVTVSPLIFTSNPSNVEHMAKSHFDNYTKGNVVNTAFRDFLGHGIFNSDNEQWRVQRKAASYEFNTKSLRAFVLDKVRHEIEGRLVPLLTSASRTGGVIDLQDILERFAFDNICSLVFAEDPDCLSGRSEEGEKFFTAFHKASHLTIERLKQAFPLIWKLKKLLNIGSERQLRESMVTVHEFVERFVRSRRIGNGTRNGDFLSRFTEDGSHSDEFLRDILISFVLAGRDTTPSALTWFFWILSSRPSIVEKIREELRSIRSRHGVEALTLDELREMNYLHAAISESLRLYPPVPLESRQCQSDDVMPDGTAVRRGWTVMYSAYTMGRTEGIWGKDCREFRPERWLEEEGVFKPRNPFEYPVFHAGPRLCLGKDMAYIQMKAVAATILEGFEVEVAEERGKPQLTMTMRMEGGLPVRVKERRKGET